MNSKTAVEFVKKVLAQTKSNILKWEIADTIPMSIPFQNSAYTYTAITRQGRLLLGKPSFNTSTCSFFIIPSMGPTYDLNDFISWYDNDARKSYTDCIKELYDYVYNSLPNADSFMDSFLDD